MRLNNESRIIDSASRLVENVADESRIEELKKINSEITAWIKLDNTEVDYPVTQTYNNQYYLTHDYKKDYSIAGSIFFDYRSKPKSDDYVIVYGHNMNGDSMFGNLNAYKDADYFNNHLTGMLYLDDGTQYELSVLAYAIVNSSNEPIYQLEDYAHGKNSEIIEYVRHNALNVSSLDKHDKLMLLSTCHEHSGKRAILLVGYNV
jgi:sortase B